MQKMVEINKFLLLTYRCTNRHGKVQSRLPIFRELQAILVMPITPLLCSMIKHRKTKEEKFLLKIFYGKMRMGCGHDQNSQNHLKLRKPFCLIDDDDMCCWQRIGQPSPISAHPIMYILVSILLYLFQTNPRSASQTVQKLEPVKVNLYFGKILNFQQDCKTENGNVFTLFYAISKRIKLEIPDWSQMKDLFEIFKMV